MSFTSIDAITRSKLLQKSLPIHYYLKYAKYAADCFRELRFDTLRVINATKLTVNSYGAVDIPCNAADIVRVGIPIGQYVRPLHQDGGISRIKNVGANGEGIPYGDAGLVASDGIPGIGYNTNDYGEHIGRFYGFHDGLLSDTYKVLPERKQIQFNESLIGSEIILEYVSDGSGIDAATKVDILAQACIEAYMDWKASRNADLVQSPEARTFYNQFRVLRARKNPLTPADIIRIYRSASKATFK